MSDRPFTARRRTEAGRKGVAECAGSDAATSARRRADAGQAALAVVVTATVVLVVLVGALAELGRAVGDAARAQTAADAVALASIDGGRAAASRIASANGAVIVSWSRGPGHDEVTVTVSVGGHDATARASNAP